MCDVPYDSILLWSILVGRSQLVIFQFECTNGQCLKTVGK